MVTHGGDKEPEAEPDSLTLSVWTPTPDEVATHMALEDQLARATTAEARREARRRIDEHFREMEHRHRDDPPSAPVDPAALEKMRALQSEHLEKQLREPAEDPPSSRGPDPNSN
jgi:hypothetical protein